MRSIDFHYATHKAAVQALVLKNGTMVRGDEQTILRVLTRDFCGLPVLVSLDTPGPQGRERVTTRVSDVIAVVTIPEGD